MKNLKVLLLVLIIVVLTACSSNKEPLTLDEFKSIMRDNDYYMVNAISQFSDYGYINDAYIARKTGEDYQIEFYELEDDSYAISFYNTNKEIFEASKTNDSIYTSIDLKDTNKYTLLNENSYKVLSRIEDTVLYIDVDKKYKNEVNSIIKKLGY